MQNYNTQYIIPHITLTYLLNTHNKSIISILQLLLFQPVPCVPKGEEHVVLKRLPFTNKAELKVAGLSVDPLHLLKLRTYLT